MDPIVELSREKIERGSKSFAAAARLFSNTTREDAYMLYAWCRHCDDVIDGQELGFSSTPNQPDHAQMARSLAELEAKTRAAFEGRAEDPVFIALGRVVQKHKIPLRHPLELLEGFRMDATGRDYHTIDDTLSYCYHVAGVVGVMMAMIMGVRDRQTLERAQDLGIAFQLTNVSRDIVDDANVGRLYLPSQWLNDYGLNRETFALPENRPALFQVVARLLETADQYYASGRRGLPALPFRSAWAIGAAQCVYSEIGNVVRTRGSAAWDNRAIVSRSRKMLAIGEGLTAACLSRWPVKTDTPRDPTLWTMRNLGCDNNSNKG